MSDLATLRSLVRLRLGVPTSDDFFTDSVVTTLINAAIATIENEQRWPWMERFNDTSIDATGSLLMPQFWRATRAVIVNGIELELTTPTDILADSSTGAPTAYAEVGSGITVRPIPPAGTTATHIWYAFPTTLVVDSDFASVPDGYSEAIVCKAAELGSAREDDSSARQLHAADYGRWIDRMRRDVRRSVHPIKVRVRPGGWV